MSVTRVQVSNNVRGREVIEKIKTGMVAFGAAAARSNAAGDAIYADFRASPAEVRHVLGELFNGDLHKRDLAQRHIVAEQPVAAPASAKVGHVFVVMPPILQSR